jgi:tight adherence protein B
MLLMILGTIFVGLGIACLAYFGSDYFARGLDYIEADFRDKLRRLRIHSPRLRAYLMAWGWFVLAVFAVMTVFLGVPVIAVAVGILLVCFPWYLVRRMAEARKLKIEDQMADAMVALSSAIKAGLSLAQALDILAEQSPRPISQEFQQIIGEYKLGKPMEQCLVEAKRRLRSENFALFAAAMEASRQSGGRLNETVDRIAHSVRELQRLERKVLSETAQARASAFYMALAPGVILALYYFVIDQKATEQLFTEFIGQMILSAAMILNVIAYLWARKILSPDI